METLLEVSPQKAQKELMQEGEGGCETAHSTHQLFLGPDDLEQDLNNCFRKPSFSFAF